MNIVQELKQNEFWSKISTFSLLLAVFIVIEHCINDTTIITDGTYCGFFNKYILKGYFFSIVCLAVPAFYILSGFLFFRELDWGKLFSKLRKRLHTLLVPYLFWNLFWLLFFVIISFFPSVVSQMNQLESFSFSFENVLEGIFLRKYNPVFWFLFDLIVFVYLSPIFYLILKNRILGGVFIGILFYISIFYNDLFPILRGISNLLEFVIGGYFAIHFYRYSFINFNKRDKILVFLLFLIIMYVNTYIFYNVGFRILASILLFYLVPSHGINIKLTGFSMYLYAMHYYVAVIISKGVKLFINGRAETSVIMFSLIFVLTFCVCYYSAFCLNKFLPNFYKFIVGGRNY